VVRVSGTLSTDTVWTADTTWILEDVVFVEPGVTLDIEPGTTVRAELQASLVVERGGHLHARGRGDAPIVFTSTAPEGERAPGDWGGIVLLGEAPVNLGDPAIDSLGFSDPRLAYGGNEPSSSCGVVEFVEVSFAGHEAALGNAPAGVTLAGCGEQTIFRQIQVHRSAGDGLAMLGGNASICNIVVSSPGDDGMDWAYGWTGKGQFLIVQFDQDGGDNAIEADNLDDDPSAVPTSSPELFNMTMVSPRGGERERRGMLFRDGTEALLGNFLLTGFGVEMLDVRGDDTVAHAESGRLALEYGYAWDVGADGITTTDDSGDDDDAGFDEAAWLADADNGVEVGTFGGLTVGDPDQPDFVPSVLPQLIEGAGPIPDVEFFDESATYLGAIAPGETDPFYSWMRFPMK
jgi:hypothetical protein